MGVGQYREIVTSRAGGACEYCRLVEKGAGVTFHVDHVIPVDRGGATALGNLALSCPGCTLAKGNQVSGCDCSGQSHLLYNPRAYSPAALGWPLHFRMNRNTGSIVGLTPVGEATVEALNMDDHRRAFARRLQMRAGLWD